MEKLQITSEGIKKNLNKTFGKKQLKSVNKKAMYQDLNNWIMLSIDEIGRAHV